MDILKTVLIIDDSIYIRQLLLDELSFLGFNVIGTNAEGKDSFRASGNLHPKIIFLDTTLPDMKSLDVLKGLLSINNDVYVVVLSDLQNKIEVDYLLRNGAKDVLYKPFTRNDLGFVLSRFLASQLKYSESKLLIVPFLYSVFYQIVISYAATSYRIEIEKIVTRQFNNLQKKYPDRFLVSDQVLQIKVHEGINSLQKQKIVFRQLDSLFVRTLNSIKRKIPIDLLKSLLKESFQSFVRNFGDVSQQVDFVFPSWEQLELTSLLSKTSTTRPSLTGPNYLKNSEVSWPSAKMYSTNHKKLDLYRVVINFDPRTPKIFMGGNEDLKVFVILSYFDEIIGPKLVFSAPPTSNDLLLEKLKIIPNLMDTTGVNEFDPFIHADNEFASINIIFTLENSRTRSGNDEFMLSVAIYPLEVNALVKATQMKGLLRATAAQINFLLSENDANPLTNGVLNMTTEIHEMLSLFVNESKVFLSY